jgi:hypothetical protein
MSEEETMSIGHPHPPGVSNYALWALASSGVGVLLAVVALLTR